LLRRFASETWIASVLLAFGAILMASNPWFSPVDDEIAIIDVAPRPAFAMMKLLLSGGGQHEHPPLSDLILHGWLWLSNGNIHLLRLRSVVFYLLGAWFLVQAAHRMAGERARNYTLILLLLRPYGLHLGRLAGWYSVTFLLVSLLTLVYLKYIERPSPRTWMPVVLCALALIYTNYFGWAVLGFLGTGSFVAIWAGAADLAAVAGNRDIFDCGVYSGHAGARYAVAHRNGSWPCEFAGCDGCL
jgi:hypothetical protein